MSSLNLALQGREITVLHCHEKLTAFEMKLALWNSKLDNKNFAPFPQLNTFLDENALHVDDDILEVMKRHVSILREDISRYFSDVLEFEKYYRFIHNPFVLSVSDLPSQENLVQEQFIDLVNVGDAKFVFREMCCRDFWIQMAEPYPAVAKMALKLLIPFPTTYECEKAFSTLVTIKTKSRNRMDVTHDMRVALANTLPNIEELLEDKQGHPSH